MVQELLRNARAIQAERGHAKGILETSDGRVCIYGAIGLAGGSIRNTCDFTVEVAKVLGFSGPSAMVAWNNAPERTLEDVLARLDQAIAATPPKPAAAPEPLVFA